MILAGGLGGRAVGLGCRALLYLHSKNIVHRDIKSTLASPLPPPCMHAMSIATRVCVRVGGNVLLLTDGTVKVSDFGVSREVFARLCSPSACTWSPPPPQNTPAEKLDMEELDMRATMPAGSPLWMAPEIIQGRRREHGVASCAAIHWRCRN